MGSKYLAQYLLNEGVLSQARLEELLPKTREMDLSECLLEAGIVDGAGLDALSDRCRQGGLHPVSYAVRHLNKGHDDFEESYYEEFMELFMEELMDFLKTPAVISLEPVEKSAFSGMGKTHAASQRVDGDLCIVTGIIGGDACFLELASRYAQEEITDIDDLAVDSIEEFLNVLNGAYMVQLAKRDLETDLETPRWGRNIVPHGSRQLVMRVCTDFGSFYAVLATDEFI
mgnify:CR=1 FL=1